MLNAWSLNASSLNSSGSLAVLASAEVACEASVTDSSVRYAKASAEVSALSSLTASVRTTDLAFARVRSRAIVWNADGKTTVREIFPVYVKGRVKARSSLRGIPNAYMGSGICTVSSSVSAQATPFRISSGRFLCAASVSASAKVNIRKVSSRIFISALVHGEPMLKFDPDTFYTHFGYANVSVQADITGNGERIKRAVPSIYATAAIITADATHKHDSKARCECASRINAAYTLYHIVDDAKGTISSQATLTAKAATRPANSGEVSVSASVSGSTFINHGAVTDVSSLATISSTSYAAKYSFGNIASLSQVSGRPIISRGARSLVSAASSLSSSHYKSSHPSATAQPAASISSYVLRKTNAVGAANASASASGSTFINHGAVAGVSPLATLSGSAWRTRVALGEVAAFGAVEGQGVVAVHAPRDLHIFGLAHISGTGTRVKKASSQISPTSSIDAILRANTHLHAPVYRSMYLGFDSRIILIPPEQREMRIT